VATKFQPGKWARSNIDVRKAMVQAARESTQRLGVSVIDLYQIHSANHPQSFKEQAYGLADVFENGLAHAVGVSNFSNDELDIVYSTLQKRGVQLASNQVEFSILRQWPEENGMLAKCRERNIQLIGYSPIAMGRLSGKYGAEEPPQGRRGFGNADWQTVDTLVQTLRSYGETHGNKTPAQVALNWVEAKGVLPIPGAKNKQQASENGGAMGWSISDDEVQHLQKLGMTGKTSNWQVRYYSHDICSFQQTFTHVPSLCSTVEGRLHYASKTNPHKSFDILSLITKLIYCHRLSVGTLHVTSVDSAVRASDSYESKERRAME